MSRIRHSNRLTWSLPANRTSNIHIPDSIAIERGRDREVHGREEVVDELRACVNMGEKYAFRINNCHCAARAQRQRKNNVEIVHIACTV